MAQTGEEYLAVLKAAYDYEPQSEDEIAIKESQIVFLLEKTDDDWWKVKVRGGSQDEDSPLGLVPAAYVEQAEHTSTVKALYDYDATAPGELSIREDEILMVFDREDEWILVQSQKEGGKAGFVPGNYVEESTGEEQAPAPEPEPEPEPAPRPQLVPPSPKPPARPVSVYMDPADRVAQTPVKVQIDSIRTWAVSEVDKKGKKKKGILGIGNGSIFFASESDKTPVQKWDTADVEDFTIERQKHILIDVGGRNPTKLHFNVGKEELAETILTKLDDSRKLAISNIKARPEAITAELHAPRTTPPPRPLESGSPSKKNGVSVRFTEESPEIIPPREPSEDGESEEGELAIALYNFEGTGPDELSVQEGERLRIIEKEGEEWWKCRNAHGNEGVVPASYLESPGPSIPTKLEDGSGRARNEKEREEAERREREARELTDREKKNAEQERGKAATEAQERQEKGQSVDAETTRRPRQGKRGEQKVESEQSGSVYSRPSASNPSRDNSSTRTSNEQKNAPPLESTRIWHDRSGQFRVEAALLGYLNGKLRLHKVNGVVIEVPSDKMSVEDMRYVERLMKKKSSSPPGTSPRASNDDDQPLALTRPTEPKKDLIPPQKKGPQMDWFAFFLSAGCDVDDCTRYAHSFERDRIDESLLPDIMESTMRSLGLREGDIIRVNKVIQQKYTKSRALPSDHLANDEELARRLQEEENAKKPVSLAPNLFAGPGGILKNNTQRRGRPQPSKSLPPPIVALDAIGTASEQIKRSGSPFVRTSSPATASPVQPPQRSSSAMATVTGFDDDAWTNRTGSKPPASNSTPPASAPPPRVPSAPPVPQATATPPPAPPAPPREGTTTSASSLANTTEADVFDQLARLSQLKTNRIPPSLTPPSTSMPPVIPPVISPPPSYNNGFGMGSSPTPIGQHLQHSGVLPLPQQNDPRGPYAPVPANQGLLQPLIPTQTGFNSFVPTRPSVSPFQPQPQPAQPSFLQPHVTGFPGHTQTIISQPTGFLPGPILTQPTGVSSGSFGGFTPTSTFPNTAATLAQASAYSLDGPTRFSPFGQSPFNNIISAPSPTPSNNNSSTSPANIFAQMKSGTFASGNEHATPQQADKYDVLRVNPQPTGWAPQPTNWGIQPNPGFQNGYTGF
ncbi:hypothetical protein JVT61DRAFT_13050 [Boletus reticuloceps]|uniref:Actin cytoskeleton-regulatory complex protein SLA1 n=1 Tax=Boletus reticuloceps TaxID=495285 RepID=A0A8I2YUH6_9AGAM|nr:hypothetical protein JVT61DRAFT_13050 [Boletus reticuloceps]